MSERIGTQIIPDEAIAEIVATMQFDIERRATADFLNIAAAMPEFGPHDISKLVVLYAQRYVTEAKKLPHSLLHPSTRELH